MNPEIAQEYTEYQRVSSFYRHADEDNAPELSYLAMGLAGEAGEFVDQVKKVIREVGQDDPNAYWRMMNEGARDKLIDELGDVLWYLNKLAAFLSLPINDLMIMNTIKLHERHGAGMGLTWPFTHITFKEAKELYNVC